ncbi:hypothetical protein ACIRBX_24945 [Kitasatospora sp. NPDC096147]|uniref:hypothetical protein n=1 Tax=Kitasatospora sp. NPDC096147 TaxID=3364093 RepID=UPI0038112B7E
MPSPKPLTGPPGLALYRRTNLSTAFHAALDASAEADDALAATTLELLAATARAHHPAADAIEYEYDTQTATIRAHALWANTTLWRRAENPTASERQLAEDLDSLLPLLVAASGLPVVSFGTHAPPRYLLRLPTRDVAATLAAGLRREHPQATALLLSLRADHGDVDLSVEHLIGPDGTSIYAIPKDPAAFGPEDTWWLRARTSTERAIRHLWRHPEHRPRFFRPQGNESLMWNHGLQLVLLPAVPALPAAPAA